MKYLIKALAIGTALALTTPTFADTNCPPATTACSTESLHWTGTGHTVTRAFHMDGEWEVQWNIESNKRTALFQVSVNEKSSPNYTWAANQNNNSAGSAYQPKGGNYYLDIMILSADGTDTWSVCAVPLK